MKYIELRQEIKQNVFSFIDIVKHFSKENETSLKTQIIRLIKKGLVKRIKRGIYCFDLSQIDELALAYILYSPSYISLETALNYYGIIPDISQTVTLINYTTTKTIKTPIGNYNYHKIKKELFFGFKKVSSVKEGYITIAEKEKALLDYFYLRKITSILELRLDLTNINFGLYDKFSKFYPNWLPKIK